MTRLAYRPWRPEGESPFGLLLHIAHGNMISLRELCAKLGAVTPVAAVTDPAVLPNFAKMLDLPVATVGRQLYLAKPSQIGEMGPQMVQFGAAIVPWSWLRYPERRVCPHCLAEEAYQKRQWDLRVVTCCPAHGVVLATICECGNDLSWSAENRCRCGRYYRDILVRQERFMLAHQEIEARIAGGTVLAPEFADMPLPQLLSLFRVVAAAVSKCPSEVLRVADASLSQSDDIEVGLQLIETEKRLNVLLASVSKECNRRGGRYGAYKMFGTLARLFDKELSGWGGATAWVKRFLAEHPDVDFELQRKRKMRASLGLVELREAIDMLGLGFDVGRRLLKNEGIISPDKRGSGAPIAVPVASVAPLAAALKDSLSFRALAQTLGISRVRCQALVDAGLIKARWNQGECYASLWVFEQAELARFWRTFTRHYAESVQSPTLQPFGTIFNRAACQYVPFISIVNAIIEGKLILRSLGADGGYFRSVMLCRDEALLFWRDEANRRCPALGTARAAKTLRMNDESLRHLIAKGFLITRKEAGAFRGHRLTSTVMDRFVRTYIHGEELRDWAATCQLFKDGGPVPRSSRAIIARLDERGIKPVSGPSVDGGRLYLFRRADLGIGEPSRERLEE